MVNYTEIIINDTMPNLYEVLKDSQLFEYDYYIRIGDIRDRDRKYFVIRGKNNSKKNKVEKNAEIDITDNEIKLHYSKNNTSYTEKITDRDKINQYEEFFIALERLLLKIIRKVDDYYDGYLN